MAGRKMNEIQTNKHDFPIFCGHRLVCGLSGVLGLVCVLKENDTSSLMVEIYGARKTRTHPELSPQSCVSSVLRSSWWRHEADCIRMSTSADCENKVEFVGLVDAEWCAKTHPTKAPKKRATWSVAPS
mmetsp:Transcript_24414/g.56881  ORF Transcript_24414/g.56881 Transcript_24414/m.56881 type:complete len:128 (-) Transcript_24414:1015-1398(-)